MALSAGRVFPPSGLIIGHQESPEPSWTTNWNAALAGVGEALLTLRGLAFRMHGLRTAEDLSHFDSTGMRQAPYYTLVYVVQGTGRLLVDGVPHELRPGSWACIPPLIPFVLEAGAAYAPRFQFVHIPALRA